MSYSVIIKKHIAHPEQRGYNTNYKQIFQDNFNKHLGMNILHRKKKYYLFEVVQGVQKLTLPF